MLIMFKLLPPKRKETTFWEKPGEMSSNHILEVAIYYPDLTCPNINLWETQHPKLKQIERVDIRRWGTKGQLRPKPRIVGENRQCHIRHNAQHASFWYEDTCIKDCTLYIQKVYICGQEWKNQDCK
jgi:hypothetical protein